MATATASPDGGAGEDGTIPPGAGASEARANDAQHDLGHVTSSSVPMPFPARTPTPPAHKLGNDPWPLFLDTTLPPELPADAPTLVESAAPFTRASSMSVYVGPHVIAALSYAFWWLSGLIVYYNERRNRFVRFHAVQSILLTGTLTVFSVLAYVASNLLFDIAQGTHQHIFATLGQGVGLLAFFLVLMFWLAPLVAAWSGAYLRVPIIGDYAERFAATPTEFDSSS